MAQADYRPFDHKEYPIDEIGNIKVGIVRTEWNTAVVDRMEQSCRNALLESGILHDNVSVYTVPGSYELPLGAKYLLSSTHKPEFIVCLGCVIQGETKHDDYISHTVARAISQLSLISGVPVVFGVLTTNNMKQAMARSGGDKGDKGHEAAVTGLKMFSLQQRLKAQNKRISF